MKTYYVYVNVNQGDDGCGYTIGCGKIMFTIDAEDDDEFDVKIKKMIKENYTGEFMIEKMLIWTEKPAVVNVKLIYQDIKTENTEIEQKIKNDLDKEEFERLKKKFGE